MQSFRDTKVYDLLAVAPLVAWYGAGIAGLGPQIAQEAARAWISADPGAALGAFAKAATLAFLALQIVLFAIRRVPRNRSAGLLPRLAALIGGNLQIALLYAPRASPGLALNLVSTGLIAIGMAGAIACALHLGRAFAVFPQARQLVTTGPYRHIRHPLYLAEQIAGLGAMLQFAMPWAAIITLASFAAQFPRMHYEEQVMAETFPAYRGYTERTARLIPFLY